MFCYRDKFLRSREHPLYRNTCALRVSEILEHFKQRDIFPQMPLILPTANPLAQNAASNLPPASLLPRNRSLSPNSKRCAAVPYPSSVNSINRLRNASERPAPDPIQFLSFFSSSIRSLKPARDLGQTYTPSVTVLSSLEVSRLRFSATSDFASVFRARVVFFLFQC